MAQPWNEDIERLLDLSPDGAGSAQLRSALQEFLEAWNTQPQSDADLDSAVTGIAGALNWAVDEARQAFARFKEKATGESNNEFTDSFLASQEHLLFGQLVGEVLDIAPVFAALLSPTGGMVGPGGVSFHVKGGVLGYHGIAHDAGGYLCRKHGVDPGYEYIKEITGLSCEDSPLAGQISGIAFWFKVLKLGWARFLASGDPSSPMSAPQADPSGDDGILLNPAELSFLQSLIMRESDPADDDLIDEGLSSLQDRGLVTGNEQEGYTVNDQLVLATAVSLEPELMLEASLTDLDDAGQAVRYYKFGDYLVEQSSPAPDQIRVAGLRDANHATERIQQVIPLAASDLEALTLSLTEDEFDTAVAAAESGDLAPGAPLGQDSAEPTTAADLNDALGSGKIVGAIRIQQFDGRELTSSRDLQFFQGSQATWLVSRESGREGQVDVGLATSATFGQALDITPTDA